MGVGSPWSSLFVHVDINNLPYVWVSFGRFIGYFLVQIGNSLSAWNVVMPSGRFLGRNAESDPNVR